MNSIHKRTLLFILNYNGTKLTCDLLSSLRAIDFPYSVWIVDNGSIQDDSEAFRAVFPSVIVKRIQENQGFAGGVNRAMEMAAAEDFEYAYEMNNDTLADNDFVTPCVEIMERMPDVDIVGSRTLTLDRTTGQFSIWGFRSDPKWFPKFKDGFLRTNRVVGCGMLLRVSTFRKFGGLDERFFLYMEETDYCFRLVESHRKVGIASDSLIRHQGKATNDGPTVRYFHARNSFLFLRLHPPTKVFYRSGMANEIVFKNTMDLLRGKLALVSAAGHGFADALRGRFGRRNRPMSVFCGILAFLLLWPFAAAYAIRRHIEELAAKRKRRKAAQSR